MRKFIAIAALGLLVPCVQAQSIAYVNMSKVFSEHPKTKQGEDLLRQQEKKALEEREGMVKELQALQEELKQAETEMNNSALSEKKRDEIRQGGVAKAQVFQEKQMTLRRFDEEQRRTLGDQTMRLRKGIVDQIRQIVKDYGIKKNYSAVIDNSGMTANGIEAVVYYDPALDITEAIVAEVKKIVVTP